MQLKTVPEDFIVVEMANHRVQEQGEYALVELTKRNLTTERALSMVADSLRVPRRFLGYAGTKDARALTRQFVSIRINEGIVERIKRFHASACSIRFIGYLAEPLSLGYLEKNRFEIVVRHIGDEQIRPLHKIPNYFDEQRFSVANAQIGRHILKRQFAEAVQLIRANDNQADARMKEYLETRQNDFVGALRMTPKNILLMYVHAYQSLLFNEVLTHYIISQDPGAAMVSGPVNIAVPARDLPDVQIPLFGFGTELDAEFGALYQEILDREGVEAREFVVRSIPFLTVEGTRRDAFFGIEGLEIGNLEDDDLYPGHKKQQLTFTLPKSCYATMVVKCLYRNGRMNGKEETTSSLVSP
jgi:tRNA pseudouridine13 synthase